MSYLSVAGEAGERDGYRVERNRPSGEDSRRYLSGDATDTDRCRLSSVDRTRKRYEDEGAYVVAVVVDVTS